jgi:hypothetical protein
LTMWSRLVGTKNPPHCLAMSMLSLSYGASGGSVRGVYRNSPEMRLTEPATMTTPNT